jgi:hypothetical protein
VRISLHGGDCCGIKHIHNLGYYPHVGIASRRALPVNTSFGQKAVRSVNDMRHANKKADCDFYNLSAPVETYEKRFKRFVSFIKEHREHGIIEVTINIFSQKAWKPVLKEQGFKTVSSGNNSNTGNIIEIWHLVY